MKRGDLVINTDNQEYGIVMSIGDDDLVSVAYGTGIVELRLPRSKLKPVPTQKGTICNFQHVLQFLHGRSKLLVNDFADTAAKTKLMNIANSTELSENMWVSLIVTDLSER